MKNTFAVELNSVVAIVAGASRGTGRTIAVLLSAAAATLYVTGQPRPGQAVAAWAALKRWKRRPSRRFTDVDGTAGAWRV